MQPSTLLPSQVRELYYSHGAFSLICFLDGVKPDSIAIRRPITCETLIKSKAKQLGFGKPTSGFIFDSNWGTVHLDYRSAAIYCHDVRHGAHAVYGAIWRKWSAQNGHYGYPITDETGATDNAGTHIRYNVFSRTNAIYWTGQHGAFLIYGDIYRRWLSIGDVKSSVGYPITDETGSGNYGGRYNDFSNGMIYWHAGTSWVHVGGLPESITWKWDPIKLNEVTGSNIVTIYSNGNVNWVSHMHDHIALKYEWAIGWVLVDADGTAVSLTKSGTVGPNLSGIPIFGGPKHDNNIDTTVYNSVISDNWRAWVAWNHGSGKAHNSLRIVSLIKDIINDIQQVYPYVTTAIAILS